MKTSKILSMALLQTALVGGMISLNSCQAHSESIYSGILSDDQPYMTKEFTLGNGGNLRVETSGGNITVEGRSGNGVKVEMFARTGWNRNADKEEIEEEMKKYDITIAQEGNTIVATARRKSDYRHTNSRLSISFKITAPAGVTSNLRTSGGNINLAGLTGKQVAETSGGNIDAENIKGNLDLETSGGNMTAERVEGDVKMQTSGGNIHMNECNGKWDARTSGGNIHVTNARGEYRIETSGGGIQLSGIRGSMDARTSGGSIDADIVELGQYLTLHTSGGSIDATIPGGKGVDLDLEGDRVRTTLNNFSGTSEKDRIVGKLNGGGIPVRMSTSGSSVALNFR